MGDGFPTMEQNKLGNSSGNFAILTAIRRGSSCRATLLPLAEASSPPLTLGFWCDARHSVIAIQKFKKGWGRRGNTYE
jgi:hypothetical protein